MVSASSKRSSRRPRRFLKRCAHRERRTIPCRSPVGRFGLRTSVTTSSCWPPSRRRGCRSCRCRRSRSRDDRSQKGPHRVRHSGRSAAAHRAASGRARPPRIPWTASGRSRPRCRRHSGDHCHRSGPARGAGRPRHRWLGSPPLGRPMSGCWAAPLRRRCADNIRTAGCRRNFGQWRFQNSRE